MAKENRLQQLNNLRGLFALEIIFGHILRYEAGLLQLPGRFMICSVAFFFFVSGWGLAESEKRKKDYLTPRFLLNKPVYLLTLAVLTFLFGCVVDLIAPVELGFIGPALFRQFFGRTNWYIWEQILFYLLFWLIYRYTKKNRVLLITVITVTAAVIACHYGITMAWVASALAFPLGLAFAEYEEKIMAFLRSVPGILVTAFLTVFGCLSLIVEEGILSQVFMRNAICFAAIAIVLHAASWKFLHNRVFRFIGKYATALYLTQFVWLDLSEACSWSLPVRLIVVPLATFLTAVLVFEPIIRLLRKYVFR